jgi:hypothetical protein
MSAHRDWKAWLGLGLAVILVLFAAFAFVTRADHVMTEYRGWNERAVVERFGPPDRDVELNESHAGPEFRGPAIIRMREQPVRELVWEGPFRTTRVWVAREGSRWVVFHAYEHGRWPGLF